MGALVGSFYAAGRSVTDLVDIALSITKKRLWTMADFDFPWKGVVAGNGVLRFLKSIHWERHLRSTSIALRLRGHGYQHG
jgi:predicted acylesterase/phospholipase RssA